MPLGDTYLELIAVVDELEAAASAFGRWVLEASPAPIRPLGWAVRTDDLDAVAHRLGLTPAEGSRAAPDGTRLHWRYAGAEEAIARPPLPFFIEWGAGTTFPGRAPENSRHRLVELRLTGDRSALWHWLGEGELPLRIVEGGPAVEGVVLSGPTGAVVL